VSGKEENIRHNLGHANLRFVKADLLDMTTLNKEMAGTEVVWHFGANTDIPSGNRITDLDLRNCTIATSNTLEAMRENRINKILFPSSATVYGDAPLIALDENRGPFLPISLYGAGKLACEGLLSAYSHLFGMRALIFRFGNVLGTRMGHGVIFDFIHKLKKDPKEMEILGDGNQEKNFFLVEDCLDGMSWAFQNSDQQCDVFNLGCESTIKVRDLAAIVAEEMGLRDVKFNYTGGKRGWLGDAPYVKFDVSKMKMLGWQAKHSSAEAVRIAAGRLIKEAR